MREKNQSIPFNQEEIYNYLRDLRKIDVMTPDRERELSKQMLNPEITEFDKKKIEQELIKGNLRGRVPEGLRLH